MSRFLLITVSLTVLTLSISHAAIYKGQQIFVKKCLNCHDSGQAFVAQYKMSEWQNWMLNKGEPLSSVHLKSVKAEKSWEYFKSKKYISKSKHLKQFLVEYAKDSGKVPACN